MKKEEELSVTSEYAEMLEEMIQSKHRVDGVTQVKIASSDMDTLVKHHLIAGVTGQLISNPSITVVIDRDITPGKLIVKGI